MRNRVVFNIPRNTQHLPFIGNYRRMQLCINPKPSVLLTKDVILSVNTNGGKGGSIASASILLVKKRDIVVKGFLRMPILGFNGKPARPCVEAIPDVVVGYGVFITNRRRIRRNIL